MSDEFQDMSRGALPVLLKHTKHGLMEWEIWAEQSGGGAGVLCTEYGYRGGKKQLSREVITVGKNAGRKNATTPYQQTCAEALARWAKQKSRKGYGLTGEESKETRAASPMLAKVFGKEAQKVQWDTAFTQPKFDGFRGLARRKVLASGKLGRPVITSRENQPIESLAGILDALDEVLPRDRVVTLDGELYCHGLSLNKIASACKKKSALSEQIQYHVYDVVEPVRFEARSDLVAATLKPCGHPALVRVPPVKVRNVEELMVCQRAFIDDGFEGAMLRHGTGGYEAGKRSTQLLKVKTFLDGEFTVVDFKLGRGKYEGVPIFTCETEEGNTFDVLAPGSLEEKRALGTSALAYVDKKITVKYAYMTKTDAPVPFQPVAVGMKE